MPRGIRVRTDCIQKARAALSYNGFSRQTDLAEELGVAKDTIRKFFNGHRISIANFQEICFKLSLNFQELADLDDTLDVDKGKGTDTTVSIEDEENLEGSPQPVLIAQPGPVPIRSNFYVKRPPIEERCYTTILQSGSLIRIKAPRQMGKTSLMTRILARASKQGYRTVPLSLQLADSEVFASLNKFLQWFCISVSHSLKLPYLLNERWVESFSSNYNSTIYFEEYLLKNISSPLVLGLDEVDCLFPYPQIANDFFGILRGWYEKARYGDISSEIWGKLRLVLVHSTEVYIPLNVNQSPFNVGLPIELQEFSLEQICELARRHKLNLVDASVKQLMDLVGGHPYLIGRAFDYLIQEKITLEQLCAIAPTEAGPYSDHLRRHLCNIKQDWELAAALGRVMRANESVELTSELAFKLHSMGLVHFQGNKVKLRCNLYRQYFSDRLRVS